MGHYTRDVKRLLAEYGYSFSRYGKGDHEVWVNDVTKESVSVDGKIILRSSANKTLGKAGVKERL